MGTGDKKRAVMTTDINDANGSYGVIGMSKKGAANGVAELDSTGKVPTSQLPSGAGPSPSSATPLMNGVGDAGSSTDYSRGDHVHPSDSGKLGTSGDGSDVTAAFTAAASRTNISTGEKLTVIFGKVAKWFSDLGAAAFRGVDAAPTANSTNLAESGGVKSALDTKADNSALFPNITNETIEHTFNGSSMQSYSLVLTKPTMVNVFAFLSTITIEIGTYGRFGVSSTSEEIAVGNFITLPAGTYNVTYVGLNSNGAARIIKY